MLLSNLFLKLGIKTYFLDYEHYCNLSNQIPLDFWNAQKGKSTIIWKPPEDKSHLLPNSYIQEHLMEGGKIILGSKSNYTFSNTIKDTVPYPLYGRSCIYTSDRVSIYNFQNETITDTTISGQTLTILLVNSLAVMSPNDLLTILWNKRPLLTTVINDIQLKKYQKLPDTGCCGCFLLCDANRTKIVPELTAACTIHDCILSTLRTYITLDLENFLASKSDVNCYCLNEIIKFVNEHIINKQIDENIAYFARDIDALDHACSLQTHKFKNSKKDFVEKWNEFKSLFRPVFDRCREITEEYFIDDTTVLGERIKDVCVISGFSVRKKGFMKKQESLNVGEDSQYSFTASSKSISKK